MTSTTTKTSKKYLALVGVAAGALMLSVAGTLSISSAQFLEEDKSNRNNNKQIVHEQQLNQKISKSSIQKTSSSRFSPTFEMQS
jgi:hypothetical protein